MMRPGDRIILTVAINSILAALFIAAWFGSNV